MIQFESLEKLQALYEDLHLTAGLEGPSFVSRTVPHRRTQHSAFVTHAPKPTFGSAVPLGHHDPPQFLKGAALDRTRHAHFADRFGQDPRASAEILDALALWVLGRVDDPLRVADRALADAQSTDHATTMGHALAYAAFLELFRRNPEPVATYSQAFVDAVSRYDLPAYWAGIAVFLQGWAMSRLAEMRRGLAIYQEQGRIWLLPEAVLAEAEASAGETDAGLRRLDDALAELERTEERSYEAEMHRIHAGILLKREPANTAAAEQSLQAAIAVAQSQKARSFELRAALALAKLYRAANRDADAHAVLAPAVEGFPPTQQFPELTDAQTLLSALNPPTSQPCPRRRSPITEWV